MNWLYTVKLHWAKIKVPGGSFLDQERRTTPSRFSVLVGGLFHPRKVDNFEPGIRKYPPSFLFGGDPYIESPYSCWCWGMTFRVSGNESFGDSQIQADQLGEGFSWGHSVVPSPLELAQGSWDGRCEACVVEHLQKPGGEMKIQTGNPKHQFQGS